MPASSGCLETGKESVKIYDTILTHLDQHVPPMVRTLLLRRECL